MRDTDLLISNNGGVFQIKVSGRANFEYAVPLRNIAKGTGEIKGIAINLENCAAMDSSFMGVLSMLALRLRKQNTAVELYNAGDNLQNLLRELGILKLFSLKQGSCAAEGTQGFAAENNASALTTAQTVSEAHKALVEADSGNEKKFGTVIEYADADVKRLSQKEQN